MASRRSGTSPTSAALPIAPLNSPAQRAFFWQEVRQQLDQLALSKDDRARIEAAVEAKVPRLTRQEYNEWLIRRDGLDMDFGEPPSFQVCGVRR